MNRPGSIWHRLWVRVHKAFTVLGPASLYLRITVLRRKLPAIRTDITWDEKVLLHRLAARLPKGATIAEIGSYLGASTSFLALGSDATQLRIHAIDTWQNEGMREGLRDTYAEFAANMESFGDRIIAHRGRSDEVVREFAPGIDLLFIDGDHSYEGCRCDLEDWLPLMKDGGVVLLHDVAWAEGVQRALREEVPRGRLGRLLYLPNRVWTTVARVS